MAAILTPFWLAGEWVETFSRFDQNILSFRVLAEGMLLLVITYFAARTRELHSPIRRVLVWIGAIVFLPWGVALALEGTVFKAMRSQEVESEGT